MSLITSRRPARSRHASIPQVVVGALVTLLGLFTVQMSALTAWIDTFGGPGGQRTREYDDLGRPFTGWSEVWHEYGSLLWALYALLLLVVIAWMWRTILTKPPRAAWGIVPVLVALSAVFWVLNLDRFYF